MKQTNGNTTLWIWRFSSFYTTLAVLALSGATLRAIFRPNAAEHLAGLPRRVPDISGDPLHAYTVHKSSGNVFEDIGLTPAEVAELAAKGMLISAFVETIGKRKLTQKEAAHRCRTDQPRVLDEVANEPDFVASDER